MRGVPLAVLALGACQPPTQIRVVFEGTCRDLGIVARSQINDPSDVGTLSTSGACEGDAPLDIVLVPESGSDAVEILVVASLGDISVDDCLSEYTTSIGSPRTCAPEDACGSCVFMRRSTRFEEGESRTLVISVEEACLGELRCDLTETCASEGRCISAATSCDDEGSCDLEEDG
jgi:hypothetical protein